LVVLAGVGAGGDVLLPTGGLVGFLARAAAFLAIGPLLVASGFLRRGEWEQARALLGMLGARLRRSRPATPGPDRPDAGD